VVIGEFEYRCTSPAAGDFSIPCILVLRVREGEIVESRDYIDPLARPRASGTVAQLLEDVIASNRSI
jgi:ketosteroid isomerase-like protein